MLKKICILLFLWVFMTSCGSDEEVSSSTDNNQAKKWLTAFEDDSFSIGIPAAWTILENTNTLLPKPHNGEVVLASSSPEITAGFSNNILILSQELNEAVSSKDFSLLNHVWVQREYSDYIKLDSKDIEFNSGDESMLYVFEAKYNTDTPRLKFIQTAAVCKNTRAYFMTIALPTTLKDTAKYEAILKTFSCK